MNTFLNIAGLVLPVRQSKPAEKIYAVPETLRIYENRAIISDTPIVRPGRDVRRLRIGYLHITGEQPGAVARYLSDFCNAAIADAYLRLIADGAELSPDLKQLEGKISVFLATLFKGDHGPSYLCVNRTEEIKQSYFLIPQDVVIRHPSAIAPFVH